MVTFRTFRRPYFPNRLRQFMILIFCPPPKIFPFLFSENVVVNVLVTWVNTRHIFFLYLVTQGYCGSRDGNNLGNFPPRGIEEWHFNIPRGSRKIKSIPRGPLGILGNEIFLNLHAHYKKSKYFFSLYTIFKNFT